VQFKTMVRFIMETCSDEVDSQLFRTSLVNGTRLRALAIQHTLPSVNCIPIWNNDIAFIITQAIIRQKGRFNKQTARDHEQGTLVLPWSKLSVKGVPTFRSITSRGPVTTLSAHIPHSTDVANILTDNNLHVLDDTSMFFSCPKCRVFRNVRKCSMFVRSGWGHILCTTCRVTTRAKTWRCICNNTWHGCHVHAARFRQSEAEMHEAPD